MFRRLCCASVLTVALVAASVSTASAAPVAPDTWVPTICGSLQQYQQAVTDGTGTLTTSLQSVTKLKNGRARIVAFLATMVTAAKTAKQQVQAAGEPSVTNGAKIANGLVSALDDSVKLFAKSKAQAAKVSIKSEAAFEKQGTKVGNDLQKAAAGLREDVTSALLLDTGGQILNVAATAPACASLAS